ncbi:MAG: alcohol dehydrogenase catalytic domain-containing protein [Chloroflexi bacterium]|nr:alcohol dehydrogenase catalytic domain-containing protein [Chloroflexota bacterium]
MKAVVLKRPRELVMMDVPRPTLRDDYHVLVRVEACGICGSDLRYWLGENPWALHTLGRHEENPPNMILGHEFSGTIEEVNASQFEHLLGKRVGVQAFRVCGHCALCRSGRENLCRDTVHIGHAQGWGVMDYYPGAYAEYCIAFGDLLHPMADHISFEEEAMRDILGVAVHAAGRATLREGDNVLCVGGGPVGLCIAQVSRARGAGRVFISDPSPLAHRVLERFGGFTCINPTTENLNSALQGQRCAAVFDSVGTAETMADALPLLAEGGVYVNLAVHDAPITLNATALGSERSMTTSSNALYRDEREAHSLIESGEVVVQPMITHRFKLDEYQQAFDLLMQVPKQAYKVVFQMTAED